MPRHRLAVALLVPPPAATEIDGLRRGAGDGRLGQLAAHVTLVPPVNVRADDLSGALRVLRAAAGGTPHRLALRLGPPATFHPVSETLYLPVDGDVGALRRLRDAVFVAPLQRPLDHPFVPHVTLADHIDEERARAAVVALADYEVEVEIDRVHLLEHRSDVDGRRSWVPVADAPFIRTAVVGRGGIELEVNESRLVDPEAAAVLDADADADAHADAAGIPDGATPLVITARRRPTSGGAVAGVLTGWVAPGDAQITAVTVPPDHRGLGVSRQLRLAFEAAAQ